MLREHGSLRATGNVNTLLFADVDPKSPEAWASFTLEHGLLHQKVYEELSYRHRVPTFYPLFDWPREDNQQYLLDHWSVHQSNASILGITSVPDLSAYDFSEVNQYEDFLALHAQVHFNENAALGI